MVLLFFSIPSSPESPEEMDSDPAPPPAADGVLPSETRILNRTDQIVTSFNRVLQEVLGEVPAKYRVAFADFVRSLVHGSAFPLTC